MAALVLFSTFYCIFFQTNPEPDRESLAQDEIQLFHLWQYLCSSRFVICFFLKQRWRGDERICSRTGWMETGRLVNLSLPRQGIRLCFSLIGGLFRSLRLSSAFCLSRRLLWLNGSREAYDGYRSRIGMWDRHFSWYRFRQQIEPNFVLRGIGKALMGFWLVQISTPDTPLTPHNWGSQNSPLNYGQTVADGETLWTDRRGEVIVVANAPK